jgi:hypothetical protein
MSHSWNAARSPGIGHARPIFTVLAAMAAGCAMGLPGGYLTKNGLSDGLWHRREPRQITFLTRGFQERA